MRKRAERGVQTWMRLASKNLYTRHKLLDREASVVIGISAALLTIMVGKTYSAVQHDPFMAGFIFPMSVCFLAAMLGATRAMHPHAQGPGRCSDEDIAAGTARLTTFEHFHQMSEEEYMAAVKRMLSEQALVDRSLSRDIHEVGVQLAWRYRLLHFSFALFMTGLLITLVFFLVTQYRMFT